MSQGKLIILIAAGAIVFAALRPSTSAFANDAPDENVSQRLAFIKERLEKRDNHADVWNDGWLYGFTAVTTGQVIALALSPTREMQDDYRVGSVIAGLGVFSQIITSNPRGNSHLLRPYPEATTAQRLAKLTAAEDLLHKTARGERKARAWWNQAMTIGVSSAAAMILAFHYDQPQRAGLRFASGLVVAQTRFWTQPTHATRAEEEYYRRFELETVAVRPLPPLWAVVAGPGLTGISVSF